VSSAAGQLGYEHWQTAQLCNLIKHATERSTFWRKRIGARKLTDVALASLPILERGTVMKQIADEGPLLRPSDQIAVNNSSTSGSSGVPVKFFASGMNARYNHVRSVAQYFLEGRDLKLNRLQIDMCTCKGQSEAADRIVSECCRLATAPCARLRFRVRCTVVALAEISLVAHHSFFG
jgi:phenylacetate-coenzyme A ligase PaaK-like adenylate-forming protein